jgi:outer membrane protein assembly factor BamA
MCVLIALVGSARADQLSPADLARKNEGGYVTGLPLAAYSTDMGFGGGARAYYYWNGYRDDDRFAVTPYLLRVFVQAFASTRGVQFHWLDLDAPRFADSPYRIRAQLIFARATNSNYFGLGERSLDALSFPGSATFDSYDDYAAAQREIVGGETFAKYDQYDLLKPSAIASIERSFDNVRVLAGLGFLYGRIRDYTGKTVDATGGEATEAQTRLATDCDAQRIVGCGGGRDHYLRLGISYDTRDFEPDPNRGVLVDATLDLGTVALGSEYDYVRFLVAARGYYSPIPDRADLVLATRATFEWQSSGTPFFSMNTFSFIEDPRQGMGGHRTLRGYRQDRFVGPVMALFNQEVRWTFARTTLWRQKLAFIAVPFLDVGRPFDRLSELSLSDWPPSYGGALRISWNLATVITADYGRSPEDSGLYINFGHIF